jgi:antitoxin HigA-1
MGIFDHLPEVENIAGVMTPGRFLQSHLDDSGVTAYKLAKQINIQQTRISEILNNKRGITADTALRFAIFFKTTAKYWLNVQAKYDLRCR